MHTYADNALFLAKEIQKLSEKDFRISLSDVLSALGPYKYLDEADAACRLYARTLEWPDLTDEVRFEVCLRLECARCYCDDAVERGHDNDAEEHGTEFLESLLVDYWRDVGRRDWLWERHVLTDQERRDLWEQRDSS